MKEYLRRAEYAKFHVKLENFHSRRKAPKQLSFALECTEIKQEKFLKVSDFCTQLLYVLPCTFQAQRAKSINLVGVSFTTD